MSNIIQLFKYSVYGLFAFTCYRFSEAKIAECKKCPYIVEENIKPSIFSFITKDNTDYRVYIEKNTVKIIVNKSLSRIDKNYAIKKAMCEYYSSANDILLSSYHCAGVIFLND